MNSVGGINGLLEDSDEERMERAKTVYMNCAAKWFSGTDAGKEYPNWHAQVENSFGEQWKRHPEFRDSESFK